MHDLGLVDPARVPSGLAVRSVVMCGLLVSQLNSDGD